MNKVLFMIINNEVRFNMDSNSDHRQWYNSLGLNPELFEAIVRGFIISNKIIFYKGSTFNYDEEVIKAAKMYTPYIRFTMQNQSLEVYCGISFTSQTNWEPIMKINENEITGIQSVKEEKKVNNNKVESGPLLEIKNNYEDENFCKLATKVTIITLVLTVITKIILFTTKQLMMNNFQDMIFAIIQIILLLITLFGIWKKKFYAKFTGIIASLLLVFTFHILDVIIGILYFLFCVDYHYYINIYKLIKKEK